VVVVGLYVGSRWLLLWCLLGVREAGFWGLGRLGTISITLRRKV